MIDTKCVIYSYVYSVWYGPVLVVYFRLNIEFELQIT